MKFAVVCGTLQSPGKVENTGAFVFKSLRMFSQPNIVVGKAPVLSGTPVLPCQGAQDRWYGGFVMSSLIDLTGQRFGRLTAISRVHRPNGKAYWLCKCDCGGETVTNGNSLRRGHSTSCGCRRTETIRRVCFKHGSVRNPEYQVWTCLKKRCLNPTNSAYHNYGGRGITVCPEWVEDFGAFLAHVGPRPTPQHTIHRIDNDKGYWPGNVRWATKKEQAANQRPRRPGSAQHGEERYNAKLNETKVLEILSSPLGYERLAAQYGVSMGTIRNIRKGKRWKHVKRT